MADLKVGLGRNSTRVDTSKIAVVADSYLLLNEKGKDDPTMVLTGKSSKDQVQDIIRADGTRAFVSTERSGKPGLYLNTDHIQEVRDHEVVMNFREGPGRVYAVHTDFSKAEMEQQINNVAALTLETSYAQQQSKRRSIPRSFSELFDRAQQGRESSGAEFE